MKLLLSASVAALAFSASSANAAVNIYVSQNASGVFAQAIGSFNTTGLTVAGQATSQASVRGTGTAFFLMGQQNQLENYYTGLSGPLAFGDTLQSFASSSSGDPFGLLINSGVGRLYFAAGYVSGTAINSTATWAGKTLADLQLYVGDYTYTLNSDTVSLHIGQAAPAAVPEPATWGLMLLGFGGIGGALRRRKVRTAVTYA